MLKVSTKSTYAIRALIDLAGQSGEIPERLSNIADRQQIPLPFLEQIFSKLKKAGIVESIRGPLGGYKLNKEAKKISLADIVTILEGPIEPVLCSQPQNRSANCHEVEGCLSRIICNELDGAVFNILRKNTIASMCGEADRLHAQPVKLNI